MKANELRIGNYVELLGNDQTTDLEYVITIVALRMNVAEVECNEDFDSWEYEDITGIELNEQWLQGLGFRTFDGTIWGIQIRQYHIQLFFYDCWNLTIESENEKCELQGYWHLHKLQNILYEITGEELTVKK